jgi:hypothetical protein
MTHREYRVDRPFPVTRLGNVWEPIPPPHSTGLSRLFNPRFPGLNSDTVMLSHKLVISSSGSHSSTSSSMTKPTPTASSRLEHRVSVFPFFINLGSFFGGLPFAHCSVSLSKLLWELFWPSGPPSGCLGCCPLGWQPDSPLALSFETLGLRWTLLYRTSLPHLIIARTIWSEWTRSQWSPWLDVRCPLSAQ